MGRDPIPGERIPGHRIHDDPGEPALALFRRGHHGRQGKRLPNRVVQVGEEEPGTVPVPVQTGQDQGASQSAPHLVPFEFRLPLFEVVSRIQIVVAMEPEEAAMEAVSAVPGHEQHLAARTNAVLRRIEAGLDVEFPNRFRRGDHAGGPVAAGDQGPVEIGQVVAPAHSQDLNAPRPLGDRPRSQGDQVPEVAFLGGHVSHPFAIDELSHVVPLDGELGEVLRDLGSFPRPAGPEAKIEADALSDLEPDRHPSLGLEAVPGGQDFVVSHRQTVPAVDPGGVGRDDKEFVGLRPPDPDLDLGQGTAAEFPDGPLQHRNLTLGHTRISRPQDSDQEQDDQTGISHGGAEYMPNAA